jgi:hypothetical protein
LKKFCRESRQSSGVHAIDRPQHYNDAVCAEKVRALTDENDIFLTPTWRLLFENAIAIR